MDDEEVVKPQGEESMMPGEGSGEMVAPKGRAALIAIFKQKHPDMNEDPDEDSLFDWAHQGLGERDELEGKYNQLNGSNEKLASIVSEDPRFAQFIAMVAGGENLMYALGKTFGNLLDHLDENSMEQLKAGQEEYKGHYKKVKDNFDAYEKTLQAYAEENKLTPDMTERINDAILDLAEAFADREIPREVIEIVHKGLDYDEDKSAEMEAAKLAGKNEAIDEMKGNKNKQPVLPDLNGMSTNKPSSKKMYAPKVVNMSDAIKDKE